MGSTMGEGWEEGHSDWPPLNEYGVKVDFVTLTAPRTEAACIRF
jgi:hypothetical protein